MACALTPNAGSAHFERTRAAHHHKSSGQRCCLLLAACGDAYLPAVPCYASIACPRDRAPWEQIYPFRAAGAFEVCTIDVEMVICCNIQRRALKRIAFEKKARLGRAITHVHPLSVLNIGQADSRADFVEEIWHVSELEYPAGRPTHLPPCSSVHGPLSTENWGAALSLPPALPVPVGVPPHSTLNADKAPEFVLSSTWTESSEKHRAHQGTKAAPHAALQADGTMSRPLAGHAAFTASSVNVRQPPAQSVVSVPMSQYVPSSQAPSLEYWQDSLVSPATCDWSQ